MNCFEKDTKYYVINILDSDNNNLCLDSNEVFRLKKTNLLDYIKETFPILITLEKRKSKLLHNLSEANNKEYTEQCLLIAYAFEKLNIPQHLLLKSEGNIILEPVSKTSICPHSLDDYELEDRIVSDTDLEKYYINDYDKKVRNFFYPSFTTQRMAKLTVPQLKKERELDVKVKRKLLSKIMKGRN